MNLHHKLIMHTVDLYIEKALQGGEVYQKDKLIQLHTKLMGYKTFHKFSPEETKVLEKVGEYEEMKKLKEVWVDFSVYATSLLNEYLNYYDKKDRVKLNINDNKIKAIRADVVKDMLLLKKKDEESYNKVKEVIDISRQTAKRYLYITDKLIKENT